MAAEAATTRGGGAVRGLAWVVEDIREVIREDIREVTRGVLGLTPPTASEVSEARGLTMTSPTEAGVCWAPRPL